MVPNGWKLTSLGDISSKIQTGPFGSQLHAHEYTDEGIPVLMPKDLIDGRADINSAAKIPETRADDLVKHKLKKGDILFSRRGDVARFGLITEESEGALCGTGCLKASISKENSALFLSYFLQKSTVRKWLEQNAVGQTMLNLNTTILSELPIMVASSKQEQQKIAKILSTWDKAISTTECLIENSTQQKKALMQQLLTGKKRLLNDEGKPFEGEWEEGKLADFAKIKKGKALSSKDLKEGSYPVIAGGKSSPYTHSDFTHENIITVSASGAYAGYIAFFPYKIWASDCSVVEPKGDNNIKYLYYWLSNQQQKIYTLQSGGAQPHIYPRDLESMKISIPSCIEQQKIATVLTNAHKEIELLEQQLADLQQEKKALMQVLLTGKKRVVVDFEVGCI
ncbi:hypothetical protein SC65A3_00091 [Psychrobacter sp. SC65A.3]|uniref:restriction endonuclease subunit S n=1 Tax=Psychrobacter sp. SC65A.3 TaxID=2983299 RepID=UPI0021DB474E|nr:restriction endonuclease subunit S [Psychrobacter sp. SC65A.3]WAI86648.1 hypothetical protein SC65A3_00091 [Psychrobacter sp. SC65A.3]|tara:strand:+ start:3408 stop:4592 length:1185 start_codon:yes stop_codon:yes gene_type:complete